MPSEPRLPEVPSCLCLHDDFWFAEAAICSFRPAGPVTAFVSRVAWNGSGGPWERCAEAAERAGAEVVVGDWPEESLHRRTALATMRERGHSHLLIPDGDEISSPELLSALRRLASVDAADVVRVSMETYWRSPRYAIRPPEQLRPALMVDCRTVSQTHIREYEGPRLIVLGPDHGVLHHLSYAGPEERIRRKLSSWGHRHEVDGGWFRRVWQGWEDDRLMRNLHPTHPPFYGSVERIDLPAELESCRDDLPELQDPPPFEGWPSVSVVIPLYGGEEDIRSCLAGLENCRDLISEVIVVDDLSPDGAATVVEAEFPWVMLLRNERNSGFAATCNAGYAASSGDCVIFLNSDTMVPRAGLVRLVESLWSSGSVGAAGPMTNNAGYYQPVSPTYTDVSRLDLFARDFAHRDAVERDVDMLVGFCLACRRSALIEAGGPPFDERFGRGLFEDTDLGYRLQRAGYRLRLANRAYVHHEGSKSLARMPERPESLLRRNQAVYEAKWRDEVASGFASHLPGLPGPDRGPVKFDPERSAERRRRRMEKLSKRADVSLCMIVRDEERVLGDCLDSVSGAFVQTVVVDTGSKDRTREIALERGAELFEIPWPESFARARNESLRHATGRWIFWLDADDTVSPESLEAILGAAVEAPDDVVAFVVPVQFVEEGPGAGTRVDHVKLFRNLPGVSFEGRIHEQILSSLRAVMPDGRIERVPGAVVLHSGYDTSPEGQAKKAVRDERLLALDLEERPDHPFVLFNLGMTAHYRGGGHQEAVDWLRKSIAAAGSGESHLRKAYSLMGVSLRELGRLEDALGAFEEGLAAVGPDPELMFQSALVLTSLGRLDEARERYLCMPLGVEGHFTSLDIGILGPKRSHNLGSVCAAMDRYAEARGHFQTAIAAGFLASAQSLFEISVEREDLRTAREALEAVGRLDGITEFWIAGRARIAEAAGEDPYPELVNLVRRFPDMPAPRMELARRLLAEERTEEAMPLLEMLDATEGIAEAAFYRGVDAIRRGDSVEALLHTRRADRLDPGNPVNEEQIGSLQRALAAERGGKEDLLLGPHVGKLGEGCVSVSVVVVTYNSAEFINRCADSVLAQLGEEDELIVVDNASADQTAGILADLAARDGRVRVSINPENIGYALAANQGALASHGKNVVFLNPDVEVGPECLSRMADLASDGVGAVGPLSDNVGGDQFVSFNLPSNLRPSHAELPAVVAQLHHRRWRETRLLMGFCLLVPREVLDRFGLLDEGCELGADDLELSWRLRRWGFELRIALSAFAFHVGGASFNTVGSEEKRTKVAASDASLLRKLRDFYAPRLLPNSQAIWGCSVFEEAMHR